MHRSRSVIPSDSLMLSAHSSDTSGHYGSLTFTSSLCGQHSASVSRFRNDNGPDEIQEILEESTAYDVLWLADFVDPD